MPFWPLTHWRLVLAAVVSAALVGAGWISRGVLEEAHDAAVLRDAIKAKDAANDRARELAIALAESEQRAIEAEVARNAAQVALMREIEDDTSLDRAGIPAERLRSIERHWRAP